MIRVNRNACPCVLCAVEQSEYTLLLKGEDEMNDNNDSYTAFSGIVLGVIGGCILWAAVYLVYQMAQS